jgi:hypothetical protein
LKAILIHNHIDRAFTVYDKCREEGNALDANDHVGDCQWHNEAIVELKRVIEINYSMLNNTGQNRGPVCWCSSPDGMPAKPWHSRELSPMKVRRKSAIQISNVKMNIMIEFRSGFCSPAQLEDTAGSTHRPSTQLLWCLRSLLLLWWILRAIALLLTLNRQQQQQRNLAAA